MASNIAVVAKTFELLEILDEAGVPMSLKDLSARADLPKPTVHRILQTLVDLGYLARTTPQVAYQLTP